MVLEIQPFSSWIRRSTISGNPDFLVLRQCAGIITDQYVQNGKLLGQHIAFWRQDARIEEYWAVVSSQATHVVTDVLASRYSWACCYRTVCWRLF
jgi:hypothetical protein